MSTHRILTPYELAKPALMGETPVKTRFQLLRGWLSAVTGGGIESIYPARTCHGLTGNWDTESSGLSRYETGAYALPQDKIDELNLSASNPGNPETLTKIYHNGGYSLRVMGYGVEYGGEFDVHFFQGPVMPWHIPNPDGFWVLKGVTMAADQERPQ